MLEKPPQSPLTPSIGNKESSIEISGIWHHSPLHLFAPNSAYMVTAATLHKKRLFNNDEKLSLLQNTLLSTLDEYGWRPQAWAIFSNHYHCIVISPEENQGKKLRPLFQRIHSQSARFLNQLDQAPGRQVWFQFRDTFLTYEKSYLARLNYVINNPVKHRLAVQANHYPFCSATWFEQTASDALRRKVASFGYDRLNVEDDFDTEE